MAFLCEGAISSFGRAFLWHGRGDRFESGMVHTMNNQKYFWRSFINALGTLVYVSVVAFLMYNGEQIFGEFESFVAPIFMLLLFVISATITGFLVLGKPILLYLDGAKREALNLFFATLLWLIIFLAIIFLFILSV